jgi:hypothetical protein
MELFLQGLARLFGDTVAGTNTSAVFIATCLRMRSRRSRGPAETTCSPSYRSALPRLPTESCMRLLTQVWVAVEAN